MWEQLPDSQKLEYKKMVLAFASLTEMFSQKAEDISEASPYIDSKYQETVFQKVFNATPEDIGNTPYDASIRLLDADGKEWKYLIGIKTFGVGSKSQKIAQFKADNAKWASIVSTINSNSIDSDGKRKTKHEINSINHDLYASLASMVVRLRNARMESSKINLQGFTVYGDEENIYSVYHILMTSKKGEPAKIYVGETGYDKIDEDNISIIGCTKANSPANFSFTDGQHVYKFTPADSQLYMEFDTDNIVKDNWDVHYADDAYFVFSELASNFYGKDNSLNIVDLPDFKNGSDDIVTESYSWLIPNDNGEVEKYSGYNAFYGVGSKLSEPQRPKKIGKIKKKYEDIVDITVLDNITRELKQYLFEKAITEKEKEKKARLRNQIVECLSSIDNDSFKNEIMEVVFRPKNEMYIPIPNAKKFHIAHPDFFSKGVGTLIEKGEKLTKETIDKRTFNLVFEPSGDAIEAFITQSSGKGIESRQEQSILGEWILRGVFQLEPYEPLTSEALERVGINGIRLYKLKDSKDVHLRFIWIDTEDLPDDYIH